MLSDSFANYVVQTAIDFADPAQKQMLILMIKPLVGEIRHLPYGKRVFYKLGLFK